MNVVFVLFHNMSVSPTSGSEVISNTPAYTYLYLKYALGCQSIAPSWDFLEFSGVESSSVNTIHNESGHDI
jgi:hypothetical protein